MTRSTADWQALLDGATPGPWHVHRDPDDIDATFIYSAEWPLCIDVVPIGHGSDYREDDLPLAASSPEAVAEVIRLREELEGLQKHMRHQPNNILADEVASAIRIILEGDKS